MLPRENRTRLPLTTALIERKDIVEMFVKYNAEEEISEGKALVIKRPANLSSDEEVIGLIFPTDYEK